MKDAANWAKNKATAGAKWACEHTRGCENSVRLGKKAGQGIA